MNNAPIRFVLLSFSLLLLLTITSYPQITILNDASPGAADKATGDWIVGMQFSSSEEAQILGMRFYKVSGETGQHTGQLWDITDQENPKATVEFVNESESGWQYAKFAAPVTVEKDKDYIISVNTFTDFAKKPGGLGTQLQSEFLTVPANGGRSAKSGYPTVSSNNLYYVDIIVQSSINLLKPANFGQNQSIEPSLEWEPVVWADKYIVEYTTDSNFLLNITTTESTTAALSLENLLNNKTYYWRVKAVTGNLDWGYSEIFRFNTTQKYLPKLSYPIGGVKLYNDPPMLSWYIHGGALVALKYDILYSTNENVTDPTIIEDVTDTYYNLEGLEAGTKYYWQVRSKTAEGVISAYSEIESFTTFGEALKPIASWPSGGNTIYTTTPTFYWYLSGVSTGLKYVVEYVEGTFEANGSNAVRNEDITDTYLELAASLKKSTSYSWRVKSKSSSDSSAWSTVAVFKTVPGAVLLKPTASWPAGNVLVYSNPPTLFWYINGSSEGLKFDIEIIDSAGVFTGEPTIENIEALYIEGPTNLTTNVSHKWRVRSKEDETTFSEWSLPAYFKVYAPVVTTVVPIPGWPTNNTTVYAKEVDLSWYVSAADPGFTHKVRWRKKDDSYNDDSTKTVDETSYKITNLESKTTYKWQVQTCYEGDCSDWSAEATFTTVADPVVAVKPHLSWPVGGTNVYSTTPQLQWYTGTYSENLRFRVEYSPDPDFGFEFGEEEGIEETYFTIADPELTPGGTYYWRVQSYDGTVTSAWSNNGHFIVIAEGFPIIPAAASPSGGVVIGDSNPVLSWFLPAEFNGAGYELQISDNKEFNDASTIATNSLTYPAENLASGSSYYWRVRSKHTNGTFSPYSNAATFSVNSVTGVNDKETIPETFELSQNYPNPFNPSTVINVGIPAEGKYSLTVYNLLGQQTAVLHNDILAAGRHSFLFNASNLTSGVYFYRLTGPNVNISKSMMLIK